MMQRTRCCSCSPFRQHSSPLKLLDLEQRYNAATRYMSLSAVRNHRRTKQAVLSYNYYLYESYQVKHYDTEP
jgi:hypothetical protein